MTARCADASIPWQRAFWAALLCAATCGVAAKTTLTNTRCWTLLYCGSAPSLRRIHESERKISGCGGGNRNGIVHSGSILPPRRVAPGRRSRIAVAAGPFDFDAGIFQFSLQANEAVQSSLGSGLSPGLLILLFVAGLASSINPCSAAALPVAAASVTALARDRTQVVMQALAFAAGSGTVLALLGLGVSMLGEQLLLREGPLQLVFPVLAVVMGLILLDLLPFRLPGSTGAPKLPSGIPPPLQGYFLGAFSAAGSSPCATPVLVTVISYLTENPQGGLVSAALLLAYALGYSAPLAMISIFANMLPLVQAGGQLGPLVSGAAILAVGTGQLITRASASLTFIDPSAMMAVGVAAGVGVAASLVTRSSFFGDSSTSAVDIVPVQSVQGLYLYRPCLPDRGETPKAFSQEWDSRRAALAAISVGFIGSGTLRPTSDSRASAESPAQMLLAAADRSPSLSRALRSKKPVVLDFSATWCRDCLATAPAMRQMEKEFGQDVQFVTLDVSYTEPRLDQKIDWWAREFKVDALPHIAFINPAGQVQTALVGALPEEVLRANVAALGKGEAELPYVMYDAFKDGRQLRFPPPGWSG